MQRVHVTVTKPLEWIAIDIIGPLPITAQAVHNWYWRLFHIAKTVADKVVTECICKLGNDIVYTWTKKGSWNQNKFLKYARS